MPYITVKDGTQIYYKDWNPPNATQTVVFSHGWPLSSDDWEYQMFFLASKGYRCIAHDRRGHGRSSQPWDGNDMDTYADDLNELFEHLKIKNAMMVGHSTGGGEVVRFITRHGSGTGKVSKAVLVSAVPPLLVKTDRSPHGVPPEVFDSFRAEMTKDRNAFFLTVPRGPFFNYNNTAPSSSNNVSEGRIWKWSTQGMASGFKNSYDCIKAFSETDFIEEMKRIEIPVLVLHGDADQVVPIEASGRRSAELVRDGRLKVYPGAPHALPAVNGDEVNEDLLGFLKEA